MDLPQTINYLNFNNYGQNIEYEKISTLGKLKQNFSLNVKQRSSMYCFDEDCALVPKEGIGLLCIVDAARNKTTSYLISFPVQINRGVQFYVMSYACSFSYELHVSTPIEAFTVEEVYNNDGIRKEFDIEKIYSISFQERNHKYSFAGESHPFYELTYVDSGKINLLVNEQSHSISTGEMLVVDRDLFHSSSSDNDENTSFLCIGFDTRSSLMTKIVNKNIVCTEKICQLVKDIYFEYISNLPCNKDVIFSYLNQLFIEIIRSNYKIRKISAPLHERVNNEIVNKCIRYIKDNVGSDLKLETISKAIAYSSSAISKLFVRHVHKSISQYIFDYRMELAKKELVLGEKNVSQIANDLGFCSIYHFSNSFKKAFGYTPNDYKKSLQSV